MWSATKTRQYHVESGHECHFAEVQSGDIRRWRHLSLDQSEPTSRHATLSAERTSICERTQCTSISSGVTDTNAISPRCNQGTFDGGAPYRSRFVQSEPTSRHSTRGTADGIKDVCLHFSAFHSMTQCRKDVESW